MKTTAGKTIQLVATGFITFYSPTINEEHFGILPSMFEFFYHAIIP